MTFARKDRRKLDSPYTDTNWIARILTLTGSEYFHTKPVMSVTKIGVKGDHITEEITYTDALPRKIIKEYSLFESRISSQ